MALGPPPPARSRRERAWLPSRRFVAAAGALVIVGVALLIWQPWQGAERRQWTSAPSVPARTTGVERAWLTGLGRWIGFVRDASEDPLSQTVLACDARLERLDPAPVRLRDVRALAGDTCSAAQAQARDRRGSQISWDPARAARANAEERERDQDLKLLLVSLDLRDVPGGRVVRRYSAIATRLSGRDATARCWSSAENWQAVSDTILRTEPRIEKLLGFAVPSQSRIELSPTVCAQLAKTRPSLEAVEVLTHESEHLVGPDGIDDEARTDCYAAQRMWFTAHLLHVPWRRELFGALYLRAMQPGLPPEYRSAECRAGGAFDLTPDDGVWP